MRCHLAGKHSRYSTGRFLRLGWVVLVFFATFEITNEQIRVRPCIRLCCPSILPIREVVIEDVGSFAPRLDDYADDRLLAE